MQLNENSFKKYPRDNLKKGKKTFKTASKKIFSKDKAFVLVVARKCMNWFHAQAISNFMKTGCIPELFVWNLESILS